MTENLRDHHGKLVATFRTADEPLNFWMPPTETSEEPVIFVCPECGGDTHDSACPFVTNYWTVGPQQELNCFICGFELEWGEMYRLIPQYPEPTDADWEAMIGRNSPEDHPVCLACARIQRVK